MPHSQRSLVRILARGPLIQDSVSYIYDFIFGGKCFDFARILGDHDLTFLSFNVWVGDEPGSRWGKDGCHTKLSSTGLAWRDLRRWLSFAKKGEKKGTMLIQNKNLTAVFRYWGVPCTVWGLNISNSNYLWLTDCSTVTQWDKIEKRIAMSNGGLHFPWTTLQTSSTPPLLSRKQIQ